MKKHIIIYVFLAFKFIFCEVYNDRFLIYINNSVGEVKINPATGFTNHKKINNLLVKIGYDKIFKWLPSARPSDRDGEVYLNRFYVVKMPKDSNNIFELIIDKYLLLSYAVLPLPIVWELDVATYLYSAMN